MFKTERIKCVRTATFTWIHIFLHLSKPALTYWYDDTSLSFNVFFMVSGADWCPHVNRLRLMNSRTLDNSTLPHHDILPMRRQISNSQIRRPFSSILPWIFFEFYVLITFWHLCRMLKLLAYFWSCVIKCKLVSPQLALTDDDASVCLASDHAIHITVNLSPFRSIFLSRSKRALCILQHSSVVEHRWPVSRIDVV